MPISFDWIVDEDLRRVVRSDWEEAIKCLNAGICKAAILLAGACLEGTLLSAIQRDEASARKLLSEQYSNYSLTGIPLRELTRVAQRMGIIGPRATEFLVKSRNLVHPGNAASESSLPSGGDAEAAIHLLQECIRKAASAAGS